MKSFCVYLTIYKGSKLPPFYIGSTNVEKLKNGYFGPVSSREYKKTWKYELKHNRHLFSTKIIYLSETRVDALTKERQIHQQLDVANNPLYINKSIALVIGCFGVDNLGSDNQQRMINNNPMKDPVIAKKAINTRKKRIESGELIVNSKNKKETLERKSQEMKILNPMFNPAIIQKMLSSRKPEDSGKGLIWVAHKESKRRTRIHPGLLEKYQSDGWIKIGNKTPIPD